MASLDPVIHHIELCVLNADDTLYRLKKFGFKLFAQRETPLCKQLAMKVGYVNFIITERKYGVVPFTTNSDGSKVRCEDFTTFCCEDDQVHNIDSVFNVAFEVRNIDVVVNRIKCGGAEEIQPITTLKDKYGELKYSIVKSCCGNVLHTIIQKSDYSGPFLVGFELVGESVDYLEDEDLYDINYIDHVTLATYRGNSERVLQFYETCFGMKKFSISNNDDINNGLILEEGVGLRLRAMEYFKCAETGLVYANSGAGKGRDPHRMMLVIVETLEGQTNCNVETFLLEHGKDGIEHVALNSRDIIKTVSVLSANRVNFRKPPILYYEELKKAKNILNLGKDLETLEKFGILLDLEESEDSGAHNFLMQIFARSLFERKTFFIEIIERSGAKGLGAGNILALVRSIREEERRKAVDAEKNKLLQAREASVAKNLKTIRAT